jgi:hypothetical protein
VSRDREKLEVLLKAYEIERTEDSDAWAVSIALVTASVGLMSLVAFALVHAGDGELPAWLIALLPIPPLPFMAFGALHAHISQVRGVVINLYESELRRLVPNRDVPAPFGHSIAMRVWVGLFGRVAIGIAGVSYLTMYIAVLVESYRHSHEQDPVLAACSLFTCSLFTVIVLGLVGRSMMVDRLPKGSFLTFDQETSPPLD